jgi:hypothetical protein
LTLQKDIATLTCDSLSQTALLYGMKSTFLLFRMPKASLTSSNDKIEIIKFTIKATKMTLVGCCICWITEYGSLKFCHLSWYSLKVFSLVILYNWPDSSMWTLWYSQAGLPRCHNMNTRYDRIMKDYFLGQLYPDRKGA